MKILFLDSIETGTWGGMEEWIRLAANGLTGRGHSVTVAGRRGSQFLARIESTASKVRCLPLDIGGDFHPLTIAAIRRELEEQRTDVIIVNFTKDIRLGGLAARLEGDVRVVWSVGLDITKDSWSHRWLTPKLIDGVIVPSSALKDQITRIGYIGQEQVAVIPIGIEPAVKVDRDAARRELRARYHLREDATIAVTVGRLVEQKGHAYLIEAVTAARERLANVYFLFLGNGPLEETLALQMIESGVRERFIFGGMVADVAALLPGADFMVHASVEEPFGIALAEGMRAELPIVATNVGGIPEVVDETCAILVPPRMPLPLADGILTLNQYKDMRTFLGENGRRRFEQHFTADKMIERLDAYLATMNNSESDHGQTKTA